LNLRFYQNELTTKDTKAFNIPSAARDPYSYDDLCKEIELMKTRDQIREALLSIEVLSDDLAIFVSSPIGNIDPDLFPGL